MKQGALGEFVQETFEILKTGQDFSELRLVFGASAPWKVKQMLQHVEGVDTDIFDSKIIREVLDSKSERVWCSHDELVENERDFLPERGCVVPVPINDAVTTCLLLGRSELQSDFVSADLSKIRTFAEIMGMAITQACLRQVRDQDQKSLREFELATGIQRNLLPIRTPACVPHYDVCIRHFSAGQISGDYVEFRPLADGSWIGTVIDVMGKGVSAALLAAIYRMAFLTHARQQTPIDEAMRQINNALHEQFGGLTHFITSTIIRIDPKTHLLEQVNAGHCPTMLVRENSDLETMGATGAPLGLFSDTHYTIERKTLEEGDGIVLVTDGCYEWTQGSDFFGWERLENLVCAMEGNGGLLWDELQRMISKHVQTEDRKDDETFFSLKRKRL